MLIQRAEWGRKTKKWRREKYITTHSPMSDTDKTTPTPVKDVHCKYSHFE
jgi:hypothetical protein